MFDKKVLFLDNKYTRWYYNIVANANSRITDVYTEKHHIIPKCLGGSNSKGNLVRLTAREHFICHRLLTKMTDHKRYKYQLWNAFSCMLYRNNKHQERYKVSSKLFEIIVQAGVAIKSARFSGENNPQYGKKGELSPFYGRKQSEQHKKNWLESYNSKDRTRTIESRKKQSQSTAGVSKSEQHRNNIGIGLLGNKNKLDKTIYTWINDSINTSVKMTRLEFCEFVGCKNNTASSLVNGYQKKHKGWKVVKEK